jgi:hypothetical protein
MEEIKTFWSPLPLDLVRERLAVGGVTELDPRWNASPLMRWASRNRLPQAQFVRTIVRSDRHFELEAEVPFSGHLPMGRVRVDAAPQPDAGRPGTLLTCSVVEVDARRVVRRLLGTGMAVLGIAVGFGALFDATAAASFRVFGFVFGLVCVLIGGLAFVPPGWSGQTAVLAFLIDATQAEPVPR